MKSLCSSPYFLRIPPTLLVKIFLSNLFVTSPTIIASNIFFKIILQISLFVNLFKLAHCHHSATLWLCHLHLMLLQIFWYNPVIQRFDFLYLKPEILKIWLLGFSITMKYSSWPHVGPWIFKVSDVISFQILHTVDS